MYKTKLKVGAHTFGYISAWWTLFSLFGIFDFIDARRYLDPFGPNAIPDFVIWGLHLLFISISALCFLWERPRTTLAVSGEGVAKMAHHTAIAAFLAHLPLFAWWHGGELELHLIVHASLLLLSCVALVIRRALIK